MGRSSGESAAAQGGAGGATHAARGAVKAGDDAKTALPRSFALVGHRASGKTQLAESILHAAGVVREPGRVDDHDTLLDADPESRARGMGLWPGFAWVPWGRHVFELIDLPGAQAASWPARLAHQGADVTVLVVSAPDGLERGAAAVLEDARQDERPLVAVLSRLDRARGAGAVAETAALLASSRRRVAVLQHPVFEGNRLVGIIDLLQGRLHRPGEGLVPTDEPVPDGLQDEVHGARERLVEALALSDDALLEHYLEHLDLDAAQAQAGLVAGVRDGSLLPVVLSSAHLGLGTRLLLDTLAAVAPDPAEWSLPPGTQPAPQFVTQWLATLYDEDGEPYSVHRVWHGVVPANPTLVNARTGATVRAKKVYRVRGPRRALAPNPGAGSLIAVWEPLSGQPGDTFVDRGRVELSVPQPRGAMAWRWLRTDRPQDTDKLHAALEALRRVDPSLGWTDESPLDGVRIGGHSHAQLDLAVERLRARFALSLRVEPVPVRYREHPRQRVERVGGTHLRAVDGDVKEFGAAWLDVVPVAPEVGFAYRCDVDEDDLPRRFHAPIGEGARRALLAGPKAGYPVQGVRAWCVAGEYDALESTDAHFELAGEKAMAAALERAGTEILEPWSLVHLSAPADAVGAVLADLASHRSRVVGLQVDEERTLVEAHCPDEQLRNLASRLDAISAGRCWFTARPSHLERLPEELVAGVVAASPFRPGGPPGAR